MWCYLFIASLVAGGITAAPQLHSSKIRNPGSTPEDTTRSCDALTPNKTHYSAEPQPDETFPYLTYCIRRGFDSVQLAVDGKSFQGLRAEVRTKDDKVVSRFDSIPDSYRTECDHKTLVYDRDGEEELAIVDIKLSGISPVTHSTNLRCLVTVIQDKKTFWVAHEVPEDSQPGVNLCKVGLELGQCSSVTCVFAATVNELEFTTRGLTNLNRTLRDGEPLENFANDLDAPSKKKGRFGFKELLKKRKLRKQMASTPKGKTEL